MKRKKEKLVWGHGKKWIVNDPAKYIPLDPSDIYVDPRTHNVSVDLGATVTSPQGTLLTEENLNEMINLMHGKWDPEILAQVERAKNLKRWFSLKMPLAKK